MKNIQRENRNKKELLLQMKMLFQNYFFPVRQNHYTLQHLLVLTIMTQCDVASTYFILKPKESKSARSKQQWRWKCSDYESFLCSYDHSLVSLFLLVLSGSVPPSDCNHPPCKGNSNPPGRNHQNFQCQYHHPLAYLISRRCHCAMMRYYKGFLKKYILLKQHYNIISTIYKTPIKAIQK